MCFSNLPVEFDEDGNPYLAEEAEDVDKPPGHVDDCGCDLGDSVTDIDLSTDPENAYEAILGSLRDDARQHIDTDQPAPRSDAETVGGE